MQFAYTNPLFHFIWMLFVLAVIGETTTFVAPNGLTFLSNGEWYEHFTLMCFMGFFKESFFPC